MNQDPIVISHLRHEIIISMHENGFRSVDIKNEVGALIYSFGSFLSYDTALGYGCGFIDGYVQSTKDRRIEDKNNGNG